MILNQVNMPQLLNLQVVLRDRLHPLVLLVREAVHKVCVDNVAGGPGRNSFLERCPEVLLFIVMELDSFADFCERFVSIK